MKEFLNELDLILEKYQSEPIDGFPQDFEDLVLKHKDEELVTDLANIVAHNYNCHFYNRKDAIINSLKQWEESKEKDYY